MDAKRVGRFLELSRMERDVTPRERRDLRRLWRGMTEDERRHVAGQEMRRLGALALEQRGSQRDARIDGFVRYEVERRRRAVNRSRSSGC